MFQVSLPRFATRHYLFSIYSRLTTPHFLLVWKWLSPHSLTQTHYSCSSTCIYLTNNKRNTLSLVFTTNLNWTHTIPTNPIFYSWSETKCALPRLCQKKIKPKKKKQKRKDPNFVLIWNSKGLTLGFRMLKNREGYFGFSRGM